MSRGGMIARCRALLADWDQTRRKRPYSRLSSRRPVRWPDRNQIRLGKRVSSVFAIDTKSRSPTAATCKLNRWSGRQLRKDECSICVLQRDRALNEADRKVQPTECETGNFCPGRGCGSSIPPRATEIDDEVR